MFFATVVYEHAAALIGKSPWEASRDSELLYQAHREAYLRYGHSPVVPAIDIYNIEAEAYGSVVEEPEGNANPAITSPVLNSVGEIEKLDHYEMSGSRMRFAIEVGQRLRAEFEEIDVRIPLSGPFSIAANLVGYENLIMEMMADQDKVVRALQHLVEGQIKAVNFARERGFDVTLFETGASPPILSPDMFKSVVLHPLKVMVNRITDIAGSPPPLIIGGDTVQIVDHILETGTKFVICPAETRQDLFLSKIYEKTDTKVRVNMNPSVISTGSWDEIRAEVDRILGLIHGIGNASIGTGPLPYETSPETVDSIKKYIEERTG